MIIISHWRVSCPSYCLTLAITTLLPHAYLLNSESVLRSNHIHSNVLATPRNYIGLIKSKIYTLAVPGLLSRETEHELAAKRECNNRVKMGLRMSTVSFFCFFDVNIATKDVGVRPYKCPLHCVQTKAEVVKSAYVVPRLLHSAQLRL